MTDLSRILDEQHSIDTIFDIRNLGLPLIVFGVGAVERAGTEAGKLGAKKVAIVTDKGIEKAGLLDKVTKILEKEKLDFEANTELQAEPTISVVNSIADFVRKGKFDSVIGLGGGSPCDTSKLISYLATNPGDVYEYARPRAEGKAPKSWMQEPLPLMTIATTAGTGAEVTHGGGYIKPGVSKAWGRAPLSPQTAIVDPEMTVTCPPRQTAATGMDGLNHMFQLFLGPKSQPLSDALILRGIRLYYNNLRRATYDGTDIRARWNLSLASLLWSWVRCFGLERDGMPACISEFVGPRYNVPHGYLISAVLPYCLEFSLPAAVDRLALIAVEAFGEDIRGRSLREAAFGVVETVANLIKDLGLPTCLKEWNVPKDDIPKLVDFLIEHYLHDATGRRPLTAENVTELFNRAWQGKIGP